MEINESISLNATLIGKDSNGMDLPIVTVRGKLEEGGSTLTLAIAVMNKKELDDNLEGIQTQLNEFLNAMRNRMTELNYKLTI